MVFQFAKYKSTPEIVLCSQNSWSTQLSIMVPTKKCITKDLQQNEEKKHNGSSQKFVHEVVVNKTEYKID